MLPLLSLLFLRLDLLPAAPANREIYRMPQNGLKVLSDRGTVVLEAAMTNALSALDRASSDRSRAEAGCRGCVPCLFQDCGQASGSCLSFASALSEPRCDVIFAAQRLAREAERSWALSQACAYYQHRCPAGDLEKESCIRIMGESCSARVLQCSLLNTMQNLEPDTEPHAQALCGQRSSAVSNFTQPRSRIVGGSPASPGSWPWLVNLQLDGGLMCGGVLVDSSWVVTAAHCFAGGRTESYWTAVVGEFDITKTDPDEQVVKVNRIIPHSKFNPKTFNNDIALVELASPVVLSEHVTPVCLPSGTEPPNGSPCLVAGWGSLYEDGPSADVVMEAKVPLLPQSTCRGALGKELVTNTMLCAGYLSGGVDSCQGDSGGPLIYQDHVSGRFQLHGITSWGDGCGEKGKPGVYTRVSTYADWIRAEIQRASGSREPTCPELLRTTEMTEEKQRTEFKSLCHFYTLTCPHGQSDSSCSRTAEDKCLTRFKKCQMRSFLQSLLDLLQRAEDYIRDKVDLTFFSQTLPQLVEHIYSSAFAHGRHKRDLDLSLSLTQIREQLGGAVVTAEPGPSPVPPALFEAVGPSVDDWEKYLRNVAEGLDQQRQPETSGRVFSSVAPKEQNIFLQTEDSSIRQLEEQYQAAISELRSKLSSRAAPPILRLDAASRRDDSPNSVQFPTSSYLGKSPSSTEESQEPWSLLEVLKNEVKTSMAQNAFTVEDTTPSEAPLDEDLKWRTVSESFTLQETVDETEFKSSLQSTTVVQTEGDGRGMTSDPGGSADAVKPRERRRSYRSLVRKRQTSGPGGKICPGVREASQQVNKIRESYNWILNVSNKNLRMTFHEVLVDLNTKNDRGLFQARVRALVGGQHVTFYTLVGLENETFYRSAPRIIATALEAFKKV